MTAPKQLYKAVRPDGTDFYTGTVQWAPPDGHEGPWEVKHPTSTKIVDDELAGHAAYATCLCLSDAPADCTGFKWPARLLVVEAPDAIHDHDHKWVTLTARVVGERPAHEVFGPQGEHVVAFLDALHGMTTEQVTTAADTAWDAAWDSAWDSAWEVAVDTALDAARRAARNAVRRASGDGALDASRDGALDASRGAAMALIVRDLISREHYDELTRTIRTVGITVHPDDPAL